MESEKITTDIGYIKLYKNSKGYNWEIKMHEGKDESEFNKLIEKMKILDLRMMSNFGSLDKDGN